MERRIENKMTIKFHKKPKTIITKGGRRLSSYGSIDYLIAPKVQRRKTLRASGLKTCSICKFPFTGFGHNPQPVKDMKVSERCCGECNDTVVIPLRFRTLSKELN